MNQDVPLAFFRCRCGLLMLADAPCAECAAEADKAATRITHSARVARPAPSEPSLWTLAVILLILGGIYVANSIAHAPSRDDAMRAMEAS